MLRIKGFTVNQTADQTDLFVLTLIHEQQQLILSIAIDFIKKVRKSTLSKGSSDTQEPTRNDTKKGRL
jgi:hypothetical protein